MEELLNLLINNTSSDLCQNTPVSPWIAIMWASMKPISWILGTLADKAEKKWDNDATKTVSKIVSHLGWFVGLFGIGDVPKSVKHRPSFKRD